MGAGGCWGIIKWIVKLINKYSQLYSLTPFFLLLSLTRETCVRFWNCINHTRHHQPCSSAHQPRIHPRDVTLSLTSASVYLWHFSNHTENSFIYRNSRYELNWLLCKDKTHHQYSSYVLFSISWLLTLMIRPVVGEKLFPISSPFVKLTLD